MKQLKLVQIHRFWKLSAGFWEETSSNAFAQRKGLRSLASKALAAGLAGIEVVLTLFASNDLAILGDLEALSV